MYILKRVRPRAAGGLAAACAAVVTAILVTATAAMAQVPPADGGTVIQPSPLAPAGGMPGWEITLIAVGAALVAAVLAVLTDRARSARRRASAVQVAGSVPAQVWGVR